MSTSYRISIIDKRENREDVKDVACHFSVINRTNFYGPLTLSSVVTIGPTDKLCSRMLRMRKLKHELSCISNNLLVSVRNVRHLREVRCEWAVL